MQTDLLRTKLFIPPARTGLVTRTRLLNQLDRALEISQTLILLSAPPGFGKTTLITDWITRSAAQPVGPKFCWLSLDSSDNDPVRIWRYLIAALQNALPGMGETALAALQAPQEVSLAVVAAELINELAAQPQPLVMVLDDYHLINTASIHDSLIFFLDHLPLQVHLAICTRSDPPLQLSRRRGRGTLTEIRAVDLRFTDAEMAAFFNESMRLGLSPEDLAALESRTEGWIVGMQMAAVSLQQMTDRHSAVAAFSGDDRYIADYLVEEVLSLQTQPVQDFLLKTSVLDRLSAPLCEALFENREERGRGRAGEPGAQEILEYLERANLFLVPLDNRRQWFRYHHLFAQLLRQRLEKTAGAAVLCDLQQRACQWYEKNNLTTEAIQLALSCRDYATAARLINTLASQMFITNDMNTLVNWVTVLPEDVLRQYPSLIMAAAWASHATSQFTLTNHYLRLAQIIAGASVETHLIEQDRLQELTPHMRAILIESGVIKVRLLIDEKHPDAALTLAERLLPYLTAARDNKYFAFNLPSVLRPPLIFELGLAKMIQGDLDTAANLFQEAADQSLGNVHIHAIGLGFRADLDLRRGNAQAARSACRQALESIRGMPRPPSAFYSLAYVVDGLLDLEEGNPTSAETQLRAGIDLARLWNFWPAIIPACQGLMRLALTRGQPDEAEHCLQELAEMGRGVADVENALPALQNELTSYTLRPKAKPVASILMPEPVSGRELEVLELLANGASNAEIAAALFVTVNTVKKHITNLYGKLGVENRVQAVEKARRLKLIK